MQRRVIAHLADRCGLDLEDKCAVRSFLDGDIAHYWQLIADHPDYQELRTMLTLLFRLEVSSSEDLGIAGLHRLWHQHSEILARFHAREPIPGGR
jgi:hypothetical protein